MDDRTTTDGTGTVRTAVPVPVVRTLLTFPPVHDPQAADEPTHLYAARVLRYILAHDVYGTLSTADLEAAHYAAARALTTRVVIGKGDQPGEQPTARTYDRIEDTRRFITRVLADRQAEAAQLADSARVPPLPFDQPPTSQDNGPRPPGGEHEPREPRPKTNPPASGYAIPQPTPGELLRF